MEMPEIIERLKSDRLHINLSKTVAMLYHIRYKRVNIDENSIVIDGNITQSFWALTVIIILPGKVTLTI